MHLPALAFKAIGISPTATTTATNFAIPVDASGVIPRCCYLATNDNSVTFMPGLTGDTPTVAQMAILQAGGNGLVIKTEGFTHIRLGTIAGTAVIHLSPLENQ